MAQNAIEFGDRVRVNSTDATEAAGLAGLVGDVYGVTTPSVSGVEVLGLHEDYALNVHFGELGKAYWFAPELLTLVDHGAGTTIQVGNSPTFVRTPEGEWVEAEDQPAGSALRRLIGKLFRRK